MGRRSIFPPGPFRHALGIHATCESFPNRAIFIDLNDSTASYPDVADCRAAGFGLRARRSLRMDDAMVQSRNPASAPLRRTIAYALTLGAAALLAACSEQQRPAAVLRVGVGVIEVTAEYVGTSTTSPARIAAHATSVVSTQITMHTRQRRFAQGQGGRAGPPQFRMDRCHYRVAV